MRTRNRSPWPFALAATASCVTCVLAATAFAATAAPNDAATAASITTPASLILHPSSPPPVLAAAIRADLGIRQFTIVEPVVLPSFEADEANDEAPNLTVRLALPLGDGEQNTETELLLIPYSLRSNDFQVLVDDGAGLHPVAPPPLTTYRGTVTNHPGSFASASYIEGRLSAELNLSAAQDDPDDEDAHDAQDRWWIQSWQPDNITDPNAPLLHVAYRHSDIIADGSTCGTDDHDHASPEHDPNPPEGQNDDGLRGGGGGGTCHNLARIAFDADFEFYTANGSTVPNTVADIESVMNGVQTVYQRDVGITYEIGTIIVRTVSNDPYTSFSASTMLESEFRPHWQSSQTGVQRDVAHMFTGKDFSGSTVGIAYLSGVCNVWGYGITQRYGNLATRTAICNHELGHNWSAPHCDASPGCTIMCSSINGCAGSNTAFSSTSITSITNYRNNASCVEVGGNLPPNANNDTASTTNGNPVTIDVLANDSTPDCDSIFIANFSSVSAGGASVTLSVGTGPGGRDRLIYDPQPGAPASDSFSYILSDGFDTDTATVNVSNTNPPPPTNDPIYCVAFTANVTLPTTGTIRNEDIAAYNTATGAWSLVFDGSDLGLGALTIDAFAILPSGDFLFSFTTDAPVPGLTGGPNGTTVDDADIVRFTPGTLGATTAGTLSFYFDASDTGLDEATAAEDIDALAVNAAGTLYVSTLGTNNVLGSNAVDEDIVAFTPTALGAATTGSWSWYLDGSDVDLATTADEDIDAIAFDGTALLLSTFGNYGVPGITGVNEDILRFVPTSTGSTTAGSYTLFRALSSIGVDPAANLTAFDYTTNPIAGVNFLTGPVCAADFNSDNALDSADLFDFLNAFFEVQPTADWDDNGAVDSQDYTEYVDAFFTSCP